MIMTHVYQLSIEDKSYIYGLLGADGCMYLNTRNRGRISLEINEKDKDIIQKLNKLIPNSSVSERTRDTNFKKDHRSIIFSNNHRNFRDMLIDFGYPIDDKKNQFTIPNKDFSERDFWRGVIDADGSLGFTSTGNPFVGLVIVGEALKTEYLKFLSNNFNIIKIVKRNKRDNVYNLIVKNEDALKLSHHLYADSSLHMDRRYDCYLSLQNWKRPTNKIRGKTKKQSFSDDEIIFILNHSIEECIDKLGRSKSSIYMKKKRLAEQAKEN